MQTGSARLARKPRAAHVLSFSPAFFRRPHCLRHFRSERFQSIMGPILGPKIGTFLVIFGVIFWTTFWEPILEPILGPDRPKRGQDEPKRAIRSFKKPKNCIYKKWFSRGTVCIFSLLRPPKGASRGPRKLPRGTQRDPKPQKKRSKIGPKN